MKVKNINTQDTGGAQPVKKKRRRARKLWEQLKFNFEGEKNSKQIKDEKPA
jgi:hypothetical protein